MVVVVVCEEGRTRHEVIIDLNRGTKMRKPMACAFFDSGKLLLRGGRLGGLGAGEDRVVAAGAREQDREADGAEHEDDGGVGGQLGKEVGCTAGPEGRLGALTAEGSGEVGGFALLEEDDGNDEERDDDVKSDEKTDQHNTCNPLGSGGKPGETVWIGAEEGT